ncbi:MAG: DNA-binding protein [Methylocystis sp.]|uniref:DNA-binding protein n=1 Tax=Methylocystis sp. TaxID=1911079 RepID=UPI003DA3DA4D
MAQENNIAGDVLDGADEIAVFLFGDPKKRRRVYHLIERGELPVFRLGAGIHARKSVLLAFIAEREVRAVTPSVKDEEAA